jgi:tellurite resistance protein
MLTIDSLIDDCDKKNQMWVLCVCVCVCVCALHEELLVQWRKLLETTWKQARIETFRTMLTIDSLIDDCDKKNQMWVLCVCVCVRVCAVHEELLVQWRKLLETTWKQARIETFKVHETSIIIQQSLGNSYIITIVRGSN